MSCSVSSGAASAAHYQNLSIDNFNQHTGRNDRASMPLYMWNQRKFQNKKTHGTCYYITEQYIYVIVMLLLQVLHNRFTSACIHSLVDLAGSWSNGSWSNGRWPHGSWFHGSWPRGGISLSLAWVFSYLYGSHIVVNGSIILILLIWHAKTNNKNRGWVNTGSQHWTICFALHLITQNWSPFCRHMDWRLVPWVTRIHDLSLTLLPPSASLVGNRLNLPMSPPVTWAQA